MPPPELPADAPVALLAEPVEVASCSAPGRTSRGRRSRRPSRSAPASSIFTNHWSDRYGSIGVLLRSLCASGMSRSSRPSKKPSSSRSSITRFAGLVAVEAGVVAGVLVEGAVGVEEVDHRQLVAQAAGVVVGVVGRRHLHRRRCRAPGRPEAVGDDRDLAAGQRDRHRLADQVLCSARRRDARPRPCRRASSRAGWWRSGGTRLVDPVTGYLIVQKPPLTVFVIDLVVGHRRFAAACPS